MSNPAFDKIVLNGRDYNFNCGVFSKLSPDTNDSKFFPISYSSIDEITITDSIFNPFLDADVTLKTPNSFIENTPFLNFNFNANNNNLFSIYFEPKDTENLTTKIKSINQLYLNGVINDTAVYASDTSNAQVQSLRIKDVNEATLEELKVSNKFEAIKTDLTVAQNIKEILTIALGPTIVDGQYNNGTEKIDKNYIFPIYFNLNDAINFLLPYNLTIEETLPTQLFLKFDYATKQFKNFTLIDVFLNAEKSVNNLESFLLGETDGPTLTPDSGGEFSAPSPGAVPKDNKLNNLAYNNVDFTITNEVFLPAMVSNTTDYTNSNSFVYVDLQSQIDAFQDKIIDRLKPLYSANIKLNVDLDRSKLGKQNYKVMSSPFNNELNVKVAKAQMYNSFILHNMSMSFVTNGQPYRQPGKFINITKPTDGKTVNTPFEHKIYGQWLVTEVKHIITGSGSYKNFIQCVKPFINK